MAVDPDAAPPPAKFVKTLLDETEGELTLYCPTTEKHIRVEVRHTIAVPREQAVWWRCPVCRGWHIAGLNKV